MTYEERQQLWQLIRAQAKALMTLAEDPSHQHASPRQAIAHAQGLCAYTREIADELAMEEAHRDE